MTDVALVVGRMNVRRRSGFFEMEPILCTPCKDSVSGPVLPRCSYRLMALSGTMRARLTTRPHERDLKVHYKKCGWLRSFALMSALASVFVLAFASFGASAAPLTTTLALDVKGKISKTNDD